MTKFQKHLWIGIGVLAIISPIGLILPEKFKAGDAWGEWGTERLRGMLGFVPKGIERLSELWAAPLSGYGFGGDSPAALYITYIASGALGVFLAWLVLRLISRHITRRADDGR